MKIEWLGHASFLITAEDGTRIITDPYATGGSIKYGKIDKAADIVTMSHEQHDDHNNPRTIKGKPEIITGVGSRTVKRIEIKGVKSFHDNAGGRQRGPNTIFCFTVDGIRVCHLGDLGHELNDRQVAELGAVDILLIPVGGFYTIDAETATWICERLKPRVVIPMHYRTAKCTMPISEAEDFLRGKTKVKRINASEIQFPKEELPAATEIVVLKHAL